jgi:multidrug efflux system membrane fusion protein
MVICVVGLVAVMGSLYVWRATRSGGADHPVRSPLSVSTIRAQPRRVAHELQAVGSLQAVREVLLAPDTPGRVTAINFDAGQFVKEDAVLVQLYDAPEQADRAAAAARADLVQTQLRRSEKLANTGAESSDLLDQRKAAAAQAVAEVRQLEARIRQKVIRAPFSGQLGVRRINPGQYLNAGDAVATLTQLEPLYVNFTLPQQDLPKLSLGALVRVTVDAVPGEVFEARINAIEPRIDTVTRNVAVQAVLPNTRRLLKSGMYVTAGLALSETAEAIVLPLTAIQTSASGDSVILVRGVDAQGMGKAVAVPVVTGRRLGNEVLVTEGIEAGDIVVVAGQNRLPPEAAVKLASLTPADSAERSTAVPAGAP